jgi:protein-tyrosine sulfotransferase
VGTEVEPGRLAILVGTTTRSGTNFVGSLMSMHPDVAFAAPGNSSAEVRVVRTMDRWRTAVSELATRSRFLPKDAITWAKFAPRLGGVLTDLLWEGSEAKPGQTLFIKDPNPEQLDGLPDLFPDARLVVIVRDGRDAIHSALAVKPRRSSSKVRLVKRQISHTSGRDTYLFITGWARAVRAVLDFEASPKRAAMGDRYLRVRFEDLQADPRAAAELLYRHYGLPVDDELLDEAADSKVVGSTFFGVEEDVRDGRPDWVPRERTDDFKPVGRWESWPKHRIALFDRLAGAELDALGYERSTGR